MTTPGGLTVTVDDLQARKKLAAVLKRTRDLSPFFRDTVDPSMSEFFRKQFTTRGAYGRQVWAPNTPLTQKLKRRPGHGRAGAAAVGQDSREMWASLVKAPAPRGVRIIRPQLYQRGTLVQHAAVFHKGQTARTIFGRPRSAPVRVPARPLIPDTIPDFLLRNWEKGAAKFMERAK